ncbi:MAG: hypothetical protein ACYDCK_01465 [Thermoplasmatota archaeon]
MTAQLALLAEYKDRLFNLPGIAIPSGATDAILQSFLDNNEPAILARFGATASTSLTAGQLLAGKNALLSIAVADALATFFAGSETIQKTADYWRKRAFDDIAVVVASPQPIRRPPKVRLG